MDIGYCMLIYIILLSMQSVISVYELPHVLKNGKIVHTDFTILSTIDYKTEYLLEHEGSIDGESVQRIID